MEETIKINDIIEFGQYPQGINGEVKPIEWQVLDVKDNKALLISRCGLDVQPFNKKCVNTTWQKCTLRKWLNNDFYNQAFNKKEQKIIVKTLIMAHENKFYQGHKTRDKLFLLSIKEVKQYFKYEGEKMEVKGTDYCYKQGAWKDENNNHCFWWLRSSGIFRDSAFVINSLGTILFEGFLVDNSSMAVRPALMIKL